MTSPLLEFRSVDLRSAVTAPYEGIRLQLTRGFLAKPDPRGVDVVVPARIGRDSGNRVADVLSILLAGRVQALTPATWRSYTDELLAVLDESGQDPGQLIVRAPYLGLGTGEVASIACRVKNYIEGPYMVGPRRGGFQTWSIELEAVAPYWSRVSP